MKFGYSAVNLAKSASLRVTRCSSTLAPGTVCGALANTAEETNSNATAVRRNCIHAPWVEGVGLGTRYVAEHNDSPDSAKEKRERIFME